MTWFYFEVSGRDLMALVPKHLHKPSARRIMDWQLSSEHEAFEERRRQARASASRYKWRKKMLKEKLKVINQEERRRIRDIKAEYKACPSVDFHINKCSKLAVKDIEDFEELAKPFVDFLAKHFKRQSIKNVTLVRARMLRIRSLYATRTMITPMVEKTILFKLEEIHSKKGIEEIV